MIERTNNVDYEELKELIRRTKEREEKISKLILSKLNDDEIIETIKDLEQESGIPIQINVKVAVDDPRTAHFNTWDKYENVPTKNYGDFESRAIVVSKVENLDPKYEQDVKLLEGRYDSLSKLRENIEALNVLYKMPEKGNLAQRVHDIVKEHLKKDMFGYLSQHLYEPHPTKNGYDIHENKVDKEYQSISVNEIYSLLASNDITFLRYNIVAKPDGLFHDETSGGCCSDIIETKIADIFLELL